MMQLKCRLAVALVGAMLGAVALAPAAEKPAPGAKINCLIITGQMRWHDIKNTTPLIKTQFEATGRFAVDVLDVPNKDAWEKAKPDLSKYGVVFINYEGEMPPADFQKAFEKYMNDGGGLVVYHFAIATWPDWVEWNKMLGMMWHPDPKSGEGMAVDPATGKLVHYAKGEGPGSHHGQGQEYPCKVFDKDNPVTKDLPAKWPHMKDELYLGFRGPAQNVTVMVTGFAPKTNSGTDMDEPVCWGVQYGKGRTFVNILGHGVDETKAADTMLLLERGAEWAATGAVTIPVPANFPKDKIEAAKMDIITMGKALDIFQLDRGRYPTTEEGLEALVKQPADAKGWNGPYLRNVPKDPWGHPYLYAFPGRHNTKGYDVSSLGPDGKEGGGDDVGNWPAP